VANKDENSTFGLSHDKLAKLWKVSDDIPADQDKLTEEQKKAEILLDRLTEPMPLDPVVTSAFPKTLGYVLEQFKPFAECSVRSLLIDPDIDPTVIWQIKEHFREKAESHPSELERQVGTAIYYAAIASALIFHEESSFREKRITMSSYRELEEFFSQLLSIRWLTPDLIELFKRARAICRKKNEASSR
jgi:hypothetical protein